MQVFVTANHAKCQIYTLHNVDKCYMCGRLMLFSVRNIICSHFLCFSALKSTICGRIIAFSTMKCPKGARFASLTTIKRSNLFTYLGKSHPISSQIYFLSSVNGIVYSNFHTFVYPYLTIHLNNEHRKRITVSRYTGNCSII